MGKLRCANRDHENDPGDVVCMGCGWPIANDSDTEEVDGDEE